MCSILKLVNLNICKRDIHVSSSLYKRIAEHNQRKQRLKVFPYVKVESPETKSIERFIYKSDELQPVVDIKKCRTVYEKLWKLILTDKNLWHHIIKIPLFVSAESFHFAKYITRTCSINIDGSLVKKDNYTNSTRIINDFIKDFPYSQLSDISFIQDLFSKIWHTKIILEDKSDLVFQESTNSKLETFYKFYHGHNFARSKHLTEFEYLRANPWIDKDMDDTIIDQNGLMRFQMKASLDYMIRLKYPLGEIIKRPSGELDTSILHHKFHPQHLNIDAVDCVRHTNLPYSYVANKSNMARNVAGFWNDSPYYPGDECEFGFLGCIDVCNTWLPTLKKDSNKMISSEDDKKYRKNFILSNALLTLYTWNHSMAINQGFILDEELKYPISSQLILIDRDMNTIRRLTHQLNTVTAQSKETGSNQLTESYPANWLGIEPPIKLFNNSEHLNEGLTDEAYGLILSSMEQPLMKGDVSNLKNFLDYREKIPYIQNGSESAEGISNKKLSINLTKAEIKALQELEERKIADSTLPKEYYPKSAHVHEVFLFDKDEKKREWTEKISQEARELGSPYLKFSEGNMEKIRESKLSIKLGKPFERVVKPPPRKI